MQNLQYSPQLQTESRFAYIVAPLLVALILLVGASVYAAPGALDTSFGEGGIVKIAVGKRADQAHSVVLQPDGKILVLGLGRDWRTVGITLARYNENGSLDQTFGTDGLVINDFSSDVTVADLALVEGGKILVASSIWDDTTSYDFALMRYLPNGELDTTFGEDGLVQTDFGSFDLAAGMAVQSDGKIVVVGSTDQDFVVARYNSDGTLDTSFSEDGIDIRDLSYSGNVVATDVVIGDDNEIVISAAGDWYFTIVRYNADGSLKGITATDIFGLDDYNDSAARAVAVQEDGKIIAAGYADQGLYSPNRQFAIARYENGNLDSSFGNDGIVIVDIDGRKDVIESVLVQSDGKIVAVGHSDDGSDSDITVVRLNTDGSLDTSFGVDGIFRDEVEDEQAAYDVLQRDGSIVVVGYHGPLNSSQNLDVSDEAVLLSITTSGVLDANFGDDGRVLTNFPAASTGHAVAIQDNGQVLIAGVAWNANRGEDFAVLRYHTDGSLDKSFGDSGYVTTAINDENRARAILVQPDGRIILVGDSGDRDINMFTVVRYNSDGSLDRTFGDNGKVTTGFTWNFVLSSDAALQPDGKIIVAGISATPGSNLALAIARYNEDGSLDDTFGTDGMVLTTALEGSPYLPSMTLLDNEKIVLATTLSTLTTPRKSNIGLVRYHSDGTLDESFGENGRVVIDFGEDEEVYAIAQQDDKILVGGSHGNLVRYNADGTLDTDFGENGRAVADLNAIHAILPRNDGKITVAGYTGDSENTDLALARFTFDGQVDEAFGSDSNNPGYVLTDISDSDRIYAATRQADNKIVVTGGVNSNAPAILVARYDEDSLPVTGVTIDAPTVGEVEATYTFTVHASPDSATTPLTYEWQATGHAPVTHVINELTDSISFSWDTTGVKEVTVTVSNSGGSVSAIHTLLLVGGDIGTVTPDEGGTVEHEGPDGTTTTIQIPAGAVTETTTLVYEPLDDPPTDDELNFAGIAFDLSAYRDGEQLDNFTFEQPVTVTVRYRDEAIVGIEENELKLYVQEGNAWVDATTTCTPPSTYTRNLEENELGVSICHLSRFMLMGPASKRNLYLPLLIQ